MGVMRYKLDGYWNRDEGRGRMPVFAAAAYVLATDADFSGTVNGDFKYIGTEEYIIVPETIKGITITQVYQMFTGTTNAKGVSVQSSYITNMSYMFYNSTNTSIELRDWSVPNNTSSYKMFYGCTSLTSLDIAGIDTSGVIDATFMFFNCSSLTSLDVSAMDTSSMDDISQMFQACDSLLTLDLSTFNTSYVTEAEALVGNCTVLVSVNMSNWDTYNIANMGGMFGNCTALKIIDLTSFDTSNLSAMGSMFDACVSLETLDLSSFDTSNSPSTYFSFYLCDNVTTAYARTTADAAYFNAVDNKPTTLVFTVKP